MKKKNNNNFVASVKIFFFRLKSSPKPQSTPLGLHSSVPLSVHSVFNHLFISWVLSQALKKVWFSNWLLVCAPLFSSCIGVSTLSRSSLTDEMVRSLAMRRHVKIPAFSWFGSPSLSDHNPNWPKLMKGGGGSTLCVCMHACLHPRSHYPLGSWAGPRDQSIPQCEHRPGEREEVSENSRGYSANLRGILLNVLPLHTHNIPPQTNPPPPLFPLPHSRLKAIKCNVKASYDCVFFIVESHFRCLGECSQNVAFLNRSIHLVNLGFNVCLPPRHPVYSAIAVLPRFSLIWALTVHSR